jgi:hypothetical protein
MSRLVLWAIAALALVASAAAQSDFTHRCGVRESSLYQMDYEMAWHFVREYQDPILSDDLVRNIDGQAIMVKVTVNEKGNINECTDTIHDPESDHSYDERQTPVGKAICAFINKWKFRQLFWCGKPIEYSGPIIFEIRGDQLLLRDVTDEKLRHAGPIPSKAGNANAQ